jgi:hypothetical protein
MSRTPNDAPTGVDVIDEQEEGDAGERSCPGQRSEQGQGVERADPAASTPRHTLLLDPWLETGVAEAVGDQLSRPPLPRQGAVWPSLVDAQG